LLMLIIGLLLRMTKQTRFRVKSVDLLLALYTAFVFVYVFVADSLIAGLYGFRGVVEPFAFYFIARRLSIRSKRLTKIISYLLIVAVLVSVFGFVQAYVLGYPFLLKYAIDPITNSLSNSNFAYMGGRFIIRASSTFSSPNQFGMYMAILMLVGFGILSECSVTGIKVMSVALVLIVGLLTTYSRSSWLAFGIGFLLMFGLRRKIKKRIVVAVFVLALLALPAIIQLDIFKRIAETVLLTDLSAAGRLPSIINGIEFVRQNPLGMGLGTSGPRSGRFDKVLDQHAENFYVLMAMEIGVAGLLLYLVLIGMTVLQLYWTYRRVREPLRRGVILGTLLALVGSSTGVMLIPSLQAIEVASLLWFFIGISVSAKSVQTLGS
jgi:O-antigen ligase